MRCKGWIGIRGRILEEFWFSTNLFLVEEVSWNLDSQENLEEFEGKYSLESPV